MTDSDKIQQQLLSLREEFADSLVQRVEQIIIDLNLLFKQTDQFAFQQTIFRQIHSLSGSAGTFGFNRLSEQSRQLELTIKVYIDNHSLLDTRTMAHLNHGLQKLRQTVNDGSDIESSLNMPLNDSLIKRNKDRQIFVVEDDPAQGHELCSQLNHFGFKTTLFVNTTEVRQALEHEKPDAMLLDIVLPEGMLAGTILASSLCHPASIPILFMSSRKDWESRLAAVRAGGSAYIDKPVDVLQLVDILDRITHRVQQKPFRVLIIDDALELAQHYSLVLRQSGMFSEVLNGPSTLLETLENFKPELILLDMYFPDISGTEIAQVLRQHQTYFSIPIVFLSTENDRDIQLSSLQQGDDFLEKPIFDGHLVSSVESRIERARALNKLMYYDGLTGLLNQLTLKQKLISELARSQRQGYPLSYIMIDLDHFKQVNDRYGHTAGDQVLKSLGHLLRQRLRQSDQIGRYGGEEFGIIMPDTQAKTAYHIINELLRHFTQLTFQSDGKEFSCTFSAGIACASAFSLEKRLLEAADESLYLAKEKGRNLVIIHKECQ